MKEKIVKDTFFYSGSTFLAKILGIIRSIVVARFLGPSLYGLWNAFSIILEYSRYSHLGIPNAMNREVPFYRGKGDNQKVLEIRHMGFTMTVIPSLAVSLMLIIISLFMTGKVSPEGVLALKAIAALILMKQLYDFFQLLFRSENEFKFLSELQVLFTVLDFCLILALVIKFRFHGFLSALILTHIFIIGYIFLRRGNRYKLGFYWNKTLFSSLAKTGILVTLIVAIENLRLTIDRLMIVKFLGVTYLGYFGISFLLVQFMFLLPNAISNIIYPRLVERYGASNRDIASLKGYVETATLTLAYFMPLLIGEIFIFLPFGVKLFLPQYIPGIQAAQITILGIFFFSAGIMMANFLVTTDRLYLYIAFSAMAALINLTLDFIFIKMGLGIMGVAMAGLLMTSFLYASLMIIFVMFNLLKDARKTVLFILKAYFPFIYMFIFLILLNHLQLNLFFKMAIFAFSTIPLFFILEKNTKVISLVYGVLKNNIRLKYG